MPAVKEKKYTLTLKYVVYATPSKVFDAVTKESIISEWSDDKSKLEPVVNGKMEMFDGWVKGEVLRFNKIKRELSYTWKPSEWSKKIESSIVDFKFEKHPAGTEVTINHFNFPGQSEADKHTGGWVDHFFEPLNDYFTREQTDT
jgi:uncharacterized protein YndB with AHSA1/START domain